MQYALVLKESTEALEEAILVAEHFFALHVLRKFAPERSHLLRFLVCLSEIVDIIIGTVSWAIDKFPNNVVYKHFIRSDNSHAHSLLYVRTYDYPKGRFLIQGKKYYQYQVSVVYINNHFFNLYTSGPGYEKYAYIEHQYESKGEAYPRDDGSGRTNYRGNWKGGRKRKITSASAEGGQNKKTKFTR